MASLKTDGRSSVFLLFLCIWVVEFSQQHGRHEQSSRHSAGRWRDGRQLFKPIPKWKCEYQRRQHTSQAGNKLEDCMQSYSTATGHRITCLITYFCRLQSYLQKSPLVTRSNSRNIFRFVQSETNKYIWYNCDRSLWSNTQLQGKKFKS